MKKITVCFLFGLGGVFGPAMAEPNLPRPTCPHYLAAFSGERLPALEGAERFFVPSGVNGGRILLQTLNVVGVAEFNLLDVSETHPRLLGSFEWTPVRSSYGSLVPILSASGKTVMFAQPYLQGTKQVALVSAQRVDESGVGSPLVQLKIEQTDLLSLDVGPGAASVPPREAAFALIPGRSDLIALALKGNGLKSEAQLTILRLNEDTQPMTLEEISVFEEVKAEDAIRIEGRPYQISFGNSGKARTYGFHVRPAGSPVEPLSRTYFDGASADFTTTRLTVYGDNRIVVDGKTLRTFPIRGSHSSLAMLVPYSRNVFVWEWRVCPSIASFANTPPPPRVPLRPDGEPLLYLWNPDTEAKVAIENAESLADRRGDFSVAQVIGKKLVVGTLKGTLLWFDLETNRFEREQSFDSTSPVDDLMVDTASGRLLVLQRSGQIRTL